MRNKLRFDGYLTKHLAEYDRQWMIRKKVRFSMVLWSKFVEIHYMLRHWEHDEFSPDEMLESIESCAVDLQYYRDKPDWNTIVTCNVLLFVHIHALIEARGAGVIDILEDIAQDKQCREISQILLRRAKKIP